jgi:hypothetical protein
MESNGPQELSEARRAELLKRMPQRIVDGLKVARYLVTVKVHGASGWTLEHREEREMEYTWTGGVVGAKTLANNLARQHGLYEVGNDEHESNGVFFTTREEGTNYFAVVRFVKLSGWSAAGNRLHYRH